MSMLNLRRKSPNLPQDKGLAKQHTSAPLASAKARRGFAPTTTTFLKLLSVACLVIFYWAYTSPSAAKALSSSYALCSRSGYAVYTVDSRSSTVQCLLVHGSRILGTGSLSEVKELWSSVTLEGSQKTFDVPLEVRYLPPEAIVVPGMSDSHGHSLEYGASRLLPLEGSKDSSAAVDRVKEYVLAHPDISNDTTRFIEGWGWDHTAWPVEKFPSFRELEADPLVRGRPIILQSKDGHAQWVSETILQRMLPLPETIEGGIIMRDEEGNPTGVFLDKAQDLVKRPALTDADRMLRFKHAVKDALSKGLTSFHDAGFDPASLEFFKRQADLGKLPVRIYGMRYFNESEDYWGGKAAKIIDKNRLTARSVKMFADGALRSGGAALFEPYTDNPETSGFMRIDPAVLYEFVPKFLSDGWQVNIHAIGDRANSIVLDVIESALKHDLKGVNGTTVRPRIEHAQIILAEDAQRLAELGVYEFEDFIASVQPTHVVSDMWYAQDRLGPERVKNLYAFRTIINAGARITLGSDFPVEDMNPLAGFKAAITRLSPDGRSPHGPDGWFPEQRLTRDEALRGFTIDPAYASFSEKELGSLEAGKIADYVVLSQNIMTIPVNQIGETSVLATVLDGRPAFGNI